MFTLRRYRAECDANFTNTQVGVFSQSASGVIHTVERSGAECYANELYEVYPANKNQSFFDEFPNAQHMFVYCNGKQVARIDSHDVYPYFKLASDVTTNRVVVCFAANAKEAESKIIE